MTHDPFADRLARVRHRFVETLESKIEDASAAIPAMLRGDPESPAVTAAIYRAVHGIVGVGPTVMFPETGRAAREVEDALRSAQQQARGLSGGERLAFEERLKLLRAAAQRELQNFYSLGLIGKQ